MLSDLIATLQGFNAWGVSTTYDLSGVLSMVLVTMVCRFTVAASPSTCYGRARVSVIYMTSTTTQNLYCGRGTDSNATTCHIDVLLSRTRVTFRVSICTPTTVVSPVVSTTAHNVCKAHGASNKLISGKLYVLGHDLLLALLRLTTTNDLRLYHL